MTNGEVIYSICDYAQEFIREYKNPKIDQKAIDAIVVDFINYYAGMRCGINLEMYTCDLRDGVKMSKIGTFLEKEFIYAGLKLCLEKYDRYGIIKSVNRNSHMNECGGKAKVDNVEAVKLIDEFIRGYYRTA